MGQVLSGLLPAVAANGADATTQVGMVSTVGGTDNYVREVRLVPPSGYTTSTHDATDNVTFTVRQLRAGSSVVADVASFTTTATDLVAETPVTMTLDETATQRAAVKDGDTFDVVIHQNASGVAVGVNILCEVEIQ